jgi:O-antigen/teichoic acid export membrane protein
MKAGQDSRDSMSEAPPPPNHSPDSFARSVRSAVIWRSGSQIAAQLLQWAATFLVIRILSPADYGLFAMAQVVLVFLNMLNGYGLASGLVQRPEVTDREIRQLFGMLILVNAALALVQLALAPLAAAYYRQPQVAQLLTVQALIYATTPFIALPSALLARAMEFRAQAKVNILASLASASTALGGALAGWGVWTLVAAPIVLFAVRGAGLTAVARTFVWPSFDFRGAGALARYGGLMAAGQLFWFGQSQADVLIAGRHLDAHDLGLYTTAVFLTQIFVSKVVPPLNEVAFSAYARIQDVPGAAAAAFVKSVRVIFAAALPFYLGLAATAEPLVLTVLGPKWAEAAPVVRLLALAMPMMTLQVLFSPVCDALGRPDIGVRNGAVGAAVLTAGFLFGVHWGAQGLAVAWILAYPIYLLASCRRSLPVIGARGREVARAIAPVALAAAGMAAVVLALDAALPPLAVPVRLAVLVLAGALSYPVALALVARDRVRELVALVRRPVAG